jgi:hypothetical protein
MPRPASGSGDGSSVWVSSPSLSAAFYLAATQTTSLATANGSSAVSNCSCACAACPLGSFRLGFTEPVSTHVYIFSSCSSMSCCCSADERRIQDERIRNLDFALIKCMSWGAWMGSHLRTQKGCLMSSPCLCLSVFYRQPEPGSGTVIRSPVPVSVRAACSLARGPPPSCFII